MMHTSVYWIHRPEHTDMFNQGYIGVSKDTRHRWNGHKSKAGNLHLQRAITKYGWENLEKDVVIVADEAYCLDVETKLRSRAGIGWNIVAGGGMPPSSRGKKFIKSAETRARLSAAKLATWARGFKRTPEGQAKVNLNLTEGGKATRFVKGQAAHNKGIAWSEKTKEAIRIANTGKRRTFLKVICPHCNTEGGLTGMKRWHFDNCRNKGGL